jgi:hypothetical protein
MMKILNIRLSAVVLLLSAWNCFTTAQEITVTASKNEMLSSMVSMHKIIGHDPAHFYVIKYVGSQYYLEKLDKDLNTIHEEAIKLFKGIKTYDLEALIHFHDELYLFVSKRRYSDITLYYQMLDKATLLPSTDLIEVTTVEFVKGNWADFHFALSRQETKLMIACRIKLALSGGQFNEFYVFGDGFDLIWKRKDAYQYKGQGPRDNKYIIDDLGNVSILSLLKRKSILSLINEVKNMYGIYRYTNGGSSFKEYQLALPDLYIRGIKVIGNDKGELICAGLYSEVLNAGIRGSFFFRIDDNTNQLTDYNLNKFDNALLSQMAEMKDPIINNEELMDYVISDMVYRANGKIIIIAEQVLNQTYNNYNHLIVICFDTNGQVYWTRVISKKQSFNISASNISKIDLTDYRNYIRETGIMNQGLNDYYSYALMAPSETNNIRETGFMNQSVNNYCSYALMAPLDKTGIILFYNDDIKNMSASGLKKAFGNPKKSYIKAITIDEYGNLAEKELIKWKKKALFPEPMRYYDTRFDTIVIPAFRSPKVNYYKISAKFNP